MPANRQQVWAMHKRSESVRSQRRRTGAPGRAERVDGLAHPGAARSRCTVAADATLLSASGRCCATESHFPEKLLRNRTYAQAAQRPARPLSAPGRRRPERSACPPCPHQAQRDLALNPGETHWAGGPQNWVQKPLEI